MAGEYFCLRCVEEDEFFDSYDFDDPWDTPGNRNLPFDVEMFHCPSSSHRDNSPVCDYVAVVGPGLIFSGSKPVSIGDIRDGPENTIMLIEISKSTIHWMEPKDVTIEELISSGMTSNHSGCVNVVFANGAVRRLRNDIDGKTLRALLTIDGGETIDLKTLLAN